MLHFGGSNELRQTRVGPCGVGITTRSRISSLLLLLCFCASETHQTLATAFQSRGSCEFHRVIAKLALELSFH